MGKATRRGQTMILRLNTNLGIIRVMNELAGDRGMSFAAALPQRHPQRDHHQVGRLGRRGVPGHDPLGIDIDDKRDIDEAGPSPHVGEVGDPDTVGRGRGEVTVEQVAGPDPVLGRDRGPDALVTPDPAEPERAHRPVHRPKGRLGHRGAAQVGRHLPSPVEPLRSELAPALGVGGPGDVTHRVHHPGIGHGPSSDDSP